MAKSRLSDFIPLINQQMTLKEKLDACLSKMEALLDLGMNTNWLNLSELTIHGYMWVLSDMVNEALKINEGAPIKNNPL
jgi:hypothetical protein